MKTRLLLSAALLMLGTFVATAQDTPPSAEAVLTKAYAQAAKEHKKVMVLFHASWCGWCKKMEASLNDPAVKKSFDDNYVITWLTILESKGKENLENPGGKALYDKYNSNPKAGIPFFLIIDAKGILLADSQMRPDGAPMSTMGDNIGCPATAKEVAAFTDILKATSKIKEPQLATIREVFAKNDVTTHAAVVPKATE